MNCDLHIYGGVHHGPLHPPQTVLSSGWHYPDRSVHWWHPPPRPLCFVASMTGDVVQAVFCGEIMLLELGRCGSPAPPPVFCCFQSCWTSCMRYSAEKKTHVGAVFCEKEGICRGFSTGRPAAGCPEQKCTRSVIRAHVPVKTQFPREKRHWPGERLAPGGGKVPGGRWTPP